MKNFYKIFFSKKKLFSNLIKQHIYKLFYELFIYIFYQILLKSLHVKLRNNCRICKQFMENVLVNSSRSRQLSAIKYERSWSHCNRIEISGTGV